METHSIIFAAKLRYSFRKYKFANYLIGKRNGCQILLGEKRMFLSELNKNVLPRRQKVYNTKRRSNSRIERMRIMSLYIKKKKIGDGKPLLCVPVMEKKKADIIKEITYLADSKADMIEWRVDAFENFADFNDVREIFNEVAPVLGDKIFLYTFRTQKQGGEAEPEHELLDDLHDLAAESHCVDLIDIEYFAEEYPAKKIRRLQKQGVHVIASHHDFEMTPPPEVMNMLLDKMAAGGADIVKLAVMPNDRRDVLMLLQVTNDFIEKNADIPVITMSMGSLGSISRICGESFGSCVTFGAHKVASAPGQYAMDTLESMLQNIHKSMEG